MTTIYKVTIRRDAQTITPVTVPAYELPVLQHIFGEENVVNHGVAGQWTASQDEYDRLEMKYGLEVVEKVYGTKAARGLDNAIAASVRDEEREDDGKAALLDQAKELGIAATKNWGTARLQAAIDAKLAE